MTKLIKLELKKIKISRYIIISILLIIFSMIFVTASIVDSYLDPAQDLDTIGDIFLMLNLILSIVFLIYSSVIVSNLIINEYNNKTMMILFTYPINRKKLIISKLILMLFILIISMIIAYIIDTFYLMILDSKFNLIDGSFNIEILKEWGVGFSINILVSAMLSLWPFIIGMRKKSVVVTIISSIIIIYIRQLIISKTIGYRENFLQITLLFIITSIICYFTMKNNINKIE